MKANNIVRGFTACAISLCLSGWSFVASATAATIVVTTNQDVVDPPFNTGGLCGAGTIGNLPGADGKVSLREAIIAANNTPGQKTITFAPTLSGATIKVAGPLLLCGGHLTLNGDVNGDETPDITVDGSAVSVPFDVIDMVSSHNTVKNMRVLTPLPFNNVWGISIWTPPTVATTVMDNTIAHNIVNGTIGVVAGLDEFGSGQAVNGVTIKYALVQDNTVLGSVLGIVADNIGDQNVITDLTLARNTVSGVTGLPGILVVGGEQNPADPNDDGATDDRLDVIIKDNTVTDNSHPGDVAGIAVLGGAFSSSHNQVTAQLLTNTVTGNDGGGIAVNVAAFAGSSDNHLNVQIRGNIVENNTGVGIAADGGAFEATDGRLDVTIKDNTVTGNSNPGDAAGIAISGGFSSSSSNQVTARILENTITDNTGTTISTGAGVIDSSHNDVEVTIRGNTLENNAGLGIQTYGAIGAISSPSGDSSGNSLNARIERNTVKNAFVFGLLVYSGLGSLDNAVDKVANGNEVHAIVTDNTITGTLFGDGMNLEAGSSGEANDNEVKVNVRKNTVCGSAAADIHAIGGVLGSPFLPDNTGTGNDLEGEISKNTASTVVVENGVAGNVATVTQFHNAPCP